MADNKLLDEGIERNDIPGDNQDTSEEQNSSESEESIIEFVSDPAPVDETDMLDTLDPDDIQFESTDGNVHMSDGANGDSSGCGNTNDTPDSEDGFDAIDGLLNKSEGSDENTHKDPAAKSMKKEKMPKINWDNDTILHIIEFCLIALFFVSLICLLVSAAGKKKEYVVNLALNEETVSAITNMLENYSVRQAEEAPAAEATANEAGRLGVNCIDVSEEEAKMGIPVGVKIVRIDELSAASIAGLKEGDIISAIDNVQVAYSERMAEVVKNYRPGDVALVSILRPQAGIYYVQTVPVVLMR